MAFSTSSRYRRVQLDRQTYETLTLMQNIYTVKEGREVSMPSVLKRAVDEKYGRMQIELQSNPVQFRKFFGLKTLGE